MPSTNTVRRLIVALCAALYVASLLLPGLQLRFHDDGFNDRPSSPDILAPPTYPPVLTPNTTPPTPPPPPPDPIITHVGWKLLLVSFFGPLKLNFAMFANVFLLLGWLQILRRRDRSAAILLGAALLFAMETFQLIKWGIDEGESGSLHSFLLHPLLGWYFWIAAMLLPLAAALYFQRRSAAPPGSNVGV